MSIFKERVLGCIGKDVTRSVGGVHSNQALVFAKIGLQFVTKHVVHVLA